MEAAAAPGAPLGPDAWAPGGGASSDDEEAALEVVALGRLPPGGVLREATHDAALLGAKLDAIRLPWTFLDSLVTDVPAGASLAARLAAAAAAAAAAAEALPPPAPTPKRGGPPPPPPP
ncbi:hypothetical protein BU14_0565s0009 [Porphyra umbilicalis]|uniref:Uncharacterized protein n=1 Tax=Porphyra umbilicalis TaxID=2786 RepID=A0A1X6NRQ8_PORUM|nr:hypothetical protein BU14_0565s0009 [Porphyra umbilicalis]|eukprot:OSX71278.1 hypothetical protein BU14_0565s0009 [Porphyra umbilicalis]